MRWTLLAAALAVVTSLTGCETHPFRRGMYCAPPAYAQPTYAPPTYAAPSPCAPACMPVAPACNCN